MNLKDHNKKLIDGKYYYYAHLLDLNNIIEHIKHLREDNIEGIISYDKELTTLFVSGKDIIRYLEKLQKC